MGLISKIEDKLSSHKDNSTESKLEREAAQHEYNTDTNTSSKPNPLQNPIQSAQTGETSHHHHGLGNSSTAQTGTRIGDYNPTNTSATTSGGPHQPFDPYTSQGQQTAANASSQNDRHGVLSSSDQTFTSGPHSHLENRDAVPTAGGQKVGSGGTGDPYSSTSSYGQGQAQSSSGHHHGRDAALVGGAGAAGTAGLYEGEKHRHQGAQQGDAFGQGQAQYGTSSSTTGGHHHHGQQQQHTALGSGLSSGNGSALNREQQQQFASGQSGLGSSSTTTGGHHGHHHRGGEGLAAGALGAGAIEGERRHHQHHEGSQPGYGGQQGVGGAGAGAGGAGSGAFEGTGAVPTERKMGGAYEAGYRDAMEHAKSELRRG